MARLRPLLARVAVVWGVVYPLLRRLWAAVRPQLVTALAFALIDRAAFLVWMPAGLVISALSLLVLERKVELDHR